MNLYEKLVKAFKEKAKQASPGNNWVLGENNRVPEMMAELAIHVVHEHDHSIMNDTSDLAKQPALRKWQKSTYGKGPYQVPDYESMTAIVQEHEQMAAHIERLTEDTKQENWNELQKQIKRFRSFKERTGASKGSSYGVSINFDGYDNDAVLVEFGGYDVGDWSRVERIETTWDNLVEDFTKKIDEADEATKDDI